MSPDPVLHVLAGPNGAGKTTFVNQVLVPETHLRFVSAGVIAAERWPDEAAEHSYDAAQFAAAERAELIAARTSFITETVFSHPSKLSLLREADRAGYRISLHVVLIPGELAVARVAERVRRGGHTVPEDKIRSRYARLWAYVRQALHLAHEAQVYDNSDASTPYRPIATYRNGRAVVPASWPDWAPDELRSAP